MKLNTNFEIVLKNKSWERVFENLISQYGVQEYYFIKNFNEIIFCGVIT
jgi:hypothetical protein